MTLQIEALSVPRPLGGMEKQFLHHNSTGSTNFCSVLFLEGSFDTSRVLSALAAVLKAYPRLMSPIIEIKKGKPSFHLPSPDLAIPHIIVKRKDAEQWRERVEQEILRQYKNERIFVTVLHGEEATEIIVSLDHSLSDGKSGHSVCSCLVAALNSEVWPEQRLGAPLETRYTQDFSGWKGLFRALHFLWKRSRVVPKRSYRLGDLSPTRTTVTSGITLSKENTLALKKASANYKSNINAAVCAATLKACYELFGNGDDVTIALNTPASLRSFIEPPAGEHELGLFISGLLHWHTLNQKTQDWQLAQSVFKAIRSGVDAGEPLMLGTLVGGRKGPPVDRKPRQFSPSLSVTNLGNIQAFPDIGLARVVDYRTLVSIWPQDSLTVVVVTYAGRLSVEVNLSADKFREYPQAAKRLAKAIEMYLLDMTAAQTNEV